MKEERFERVVEWQDKKSHPFELVDLALALGYISGTIISYSMIIFNKIGIAIGFIILFISIILGARFEKKKIVYYRRIK